MYEPLGLMCEKLIIEAEGQKYGACEFEIKSRRIKFRVAKITPTKMGQFVTFWKRIGNSPIMPYDILDPLDVLVVSVRTSENCFFYFSCRCAAEKRLVIKRWQGWKAANAGISSVGYC